MFFNTDVFSLNPPSNKIYSLKGTKLPDSNDVFFRSKQSELIEQYSAARVFMYETETDDWNHWFNPSQDNSINEYSQLIFKSHFYETALFYYNSVVDISWTMCYVAIEYACSSQGKRVNVSGIQPIEEAIKMLRSAENNVTSPTAKNNPFDYLKLMCPEFISVIDQIINFWNTFSSSEIRKRYNYCKHKGRPYYTEIENYYSNRAFAIYIKDIPSGKMTQMVSDLHDVQYSFSLEQAIKDLTDFDNNVLFPYIQNLINSIEGILQPSPMI